jgi:hypothetical protein
VDDIGRIVQTASEPGLSGAVLGAGLDRLDLQPPYYFERLGTVKQVCAEHGVEIIPIIFSGGYGGSVMAHDRNLPAVGILYTTWQDKYELLAPFGDLASVAFVDDQLAKVLDALDESARR